MKRILTFILTIAIMITMILPAQGFALENKELENAITTAKSLFNIGDGYDDFNYGMSKRNSLNVYNLSWRDTKNKLGSIDVTIDTSGRVFNYNSYRPYDYMDSRSKLPTISKADALNTANAFIKKVNPAAYSKIRYQENNDIENIGNTNYSFNYIRVENSVPMYNNYINVGVNNRTGEVQYYYCDWTDDIEFPKTDGILTMENAKKVYMDKLGLKLMYKMSYGSDSSYPYLVYSQVYTNRTIDAKTGEIINLSPYYYYGAEKSMGGMGDMGAQYATAANTPSLSPEETKAIEKASNLIGEKNAEEIARKTLAIDSTFKLQSINLYNSWINKGDHLWDIYFVKDDNNSASASIDASTGEIISFYKSVPYDSKSPVSYNKEQCINIAKELIKSLQPNKANDVELTEWENYDVRPLNDGELPRQYYLTFTRKSNNIYFPGNGFNITVDAVQGIVTNYNYSWYKGALPSANNVISSQKAHESLFANIGLELQYSADYSNAETAKILPPQTEAKPTIRLVYTVKPGKSVNIDALSGIVLDGSGKPYEEMSAKKYTDIKGCDGENEIKILAQYGISLPGTEFKPTSNITQRDFLYLLAKSVNYYFTDDDSLYNYLISANVLKEGEKSPGASISRQDAVKFIIRALKYDHVADIKGIYNLTFSDKDKIDPNLYGYMAIAYGLNIIKADNKAIKPSDSLTRGGAAKMLYNMLNAN